MPSVFYFKVVYENTWLSERIHSSWSTKLLWLRNFRRKTSYFCLHLSLHAGWRVDSGLRLEWSHFRRIDLRSIEELFRQVFFFCLNFQRSAGLFLLVVCVPERIVPHLFGHPTLSVLVGKEHGLFDTLSLVVNVSVVDDTVPIIVYLLKHFLHIYRLAQKFLNRHSLLNLVMIVLRLSHWSTHLTYKSTFAASTNAASADWRSSTMCLDHLSCKATFIVSTKALSTHRRFPVFLRDEMIFRVFLNGWKIWS